MKKSTIILSILLIVVIALAQNTANNLVKQKPKHEVTFIELGSVNCIPCKMMQPVMKEIENEYKDKISVVFYDVWQPKDKAMASKYKVRVIPTQVFLDKKGKEFHRHEGFYAAEDIKKVLDKQLGIKRPKSSNNDNK